MNYNGVFKFDVIVTDRLRGAAETAVARTSVLKQSAEQQRLVQKLKRTKPTSQADDTQDITCQAAGHDGEIREKHERERA